MITAVVCVSAIFIAVGLFVSFVYLQRKYEFFGTSVARRTDLLKEHLSPLFGSGPVLGIALLVGLFVTRGSLGSAYVLAGTISMAGCGAPEWAHVVGDIVRCIEFERDHKACLVEIPAALGVSAAVDACIHTRGELRNQRRPSVAPSR